MFYCLVWIIIFIPCLIAFPTIVIGRRNIPRKGRLLFCANHQTNNDVIILGHKILRRKFKFMAKAPLFKHKLGAACLRSLGAYPVHNKEYDISAVKTTLRHLNNEKAVCIFPEGRRLESNANNDLKNGVAMFALKTKSPIVPAFFIRKTLAFRWNKLIIGKPFLLSEMEEFKDKKIDKDLLEKASDVIGNKIYNLQKEYLQKKEDKKLKKLQKRERKNKKSR